MVLFKLIPIFLTLIVGFALSTDNGPIVKTKSGKIQGFLDTSTKGKEFYTFQKIPFAQPPTGKLRFQIPEAVKPWKGIRDGSQKQGSCPCPEILTLYKNKEKIYEGDEDCLHLSVSTPKIHGDLLPVLLFIHGGGFVGVSSEIFGSHEFMNEDVVYVAIDYRLGILGFLSTEDGVIPGNLGLRDQTMALRWVKENIQSFGGDPERITIFGNSAGGASVHYHILAPSSKGLFNRAILQSGTALCPWTYSENKKSIAHQLGAAVGCLTPANVGKGQSKRLLKCLQEVDAEKIAMAITSFLNWNFLPNVFSPHVDGDYLPDDPETLMREGRHHHVDIMIGLCRDEGAWLTESVYSDNDQIELLNKDFDYYGPISLSLNHENSSELIAAEIYKHYLSKLEVNEENADKVTEMFGDRHFKICSDIVTEMHSNNVKTAGKKVYSYHLDYKGQRSLHDFYNIQFGRHWIGHADEVFYQFPMHTMGGFPNRDDKDKKMRDMFTKMWTNFASTGNPTPDSSLGFTWQPFTKTNPKHLSIKLHPEMKAYDRTDIRQFWRSLPTRQNQLLYGSKSKEVPTRSDL